MAPNTPQFNPVETAYCFTGAFFKTAIVAPVVAPAKPIYRIKNVSLLLLLVEHTEVLCLPIILEPTKTLFAVSVDLLIEVMQVFVEGEQRKKRKKKFARVNLLINSLKRVTEHRYVNHSS